MGAGTLVLLASLAAAAASEAGGSCPLANGGSRPEDAPYDAARASYAALKRSGRRLMNVVKHAGDLRAAGVTAMLQGTHLVHTFAALIDQVSPLLDTPPPPSAGEARDRMEQEVPMNILRLVRDARVKEFGAAVEEEAAATAATPPPKGGHTKAAKPRRRPAPTWKNPPKRLSPSGGDPETCAIAAAELGAAPPNPLLVPADAAEAAAHCGKLDLNVAPDAPEDLLGPFDTVAGMVCYAAGITGQACEVVRRITGHSRCRCPTTPHPTAVAGLAQLTGPLAVNCSFYGLQDQVAAHDCAASGSTSGGHGAGGTNICDEVIAAATPCCQEEAVALAADGTEAAGAAETAAAGGSGNGTAVVFEVTIDGGSVVTATRSPPPPPQQPAASKAAASAVGAAGAGSGSSRNPFPCRACPAGSDGSSDPPAALALPPSTACLWQVLRGVHPACPRAFECAAHVKIGTGKAAAPSTAAY